MSASSECPVGRTPCQIPQCAIDGDCILRRRESVIKILERDAHEAHARAANAIGTRKVLWNLLGECLPLLKMDAVTTDDPEDERLMRDLIQRIEDARSVVQSEDLPERTHGRLA